MTPKQLAQWRALYVWTPETSPVRLIDKVIMYTAGWLIDRLPPRIMNPFLRNLEVGDTCLSVAKDTIECGDMRP